MSQENQEPSLSFFQVFANPHGAKVIEHLRSVFGTESATFIRSADGSYNDTNAKIRDGQRQVIIHIEKCIQKATNAAKQEKPKQAKTDI